MLIGVPSAVPSSFREAGYLYKLIEQSGLGIYYVGPVGTVGAVGR